MLPFRRSSPDVPDATGTTDLRAAVQNCLELITRMSQALDVPVEDKVRIRRLKMAATQARGEVELDAVAMDIRSLEVTVPVNLNNADAGPTADSFVAAASDAAEQVATATEVPGLSKELRRLAAHPPPDPLPPAFIEFQGEMKKVADAVRFLRRRGDVLGQTAGNMAHMLSTLADTNPDMLNRLRSTEQGIEAAGDIQELNVLREKLLQDTRALVKEAEERARTSDTMRELVTLHQSHKELLETALADATAMAVRDVLTGIGNRRALDRAVHQAASETGDVGVISLELDAIRTISDRFGRDGGDDALRQLAALIAGELQGTDEVFRLEGSVFVVLTRGTTIAETQNRAKEICRHIAQHPFRLRGESANLTASAGASLWKAGKAFRQVLSVADQCRADVQSKGGNDVRTKRA